MAEIEKSSTGDDDEQINVYEIQPSVDCALVNMYDRYFQVTMRGRKPILSFVDFFNQIIIRGLVAYSEPLEKIEKKIGITETDGT